jgi:predicted phosphodiesterase
MRWLCISDIQGDADALAAVLATADKRGFDKLLVAGDLCFPGPAPLEVWRRLTQAQATCVQGVGDRAIAMVDPAALSPRDPHEIERVAHLARVRRELGDVILARLARLPESVRLPLPPVLPAGGDRPIVGELLLVHGSPLDPTEPLRHDMSDDELRALLGDDPADVIVCGGSHVPFDRTVMDVRIINVGSVGDAPSGGGPRHADATFLELRDGTLWVEPFVVPLTPTG